MTPVSCPTCKRLVHIDSNGYLKRHRGQRLGICDRSGMYVHFVPKSADERSREGDMNG